MNPFAEGSRDFPSSIANFDPANARRLKTMLHRRRLHDLLGSATAVHGVGRLLHFAEALWDCRRAKTYMHPKRDDTTSLGNGRFRILGSDGAVAYETFAEPVDDEKAAHEAACAKGRTWVDDQ
ncbi:hypothetical protein [Nitrosospira briensis]|uniref:hypothetical protein n=1 Tax=Nitrosospira briensis TaxID=35799 RepID=UPI001C432143|nr:hypothetical protein [Nitrosospira briensis]